MPMQATDRVTAILLARAIVNGLLNIPGCGDLDDEQPIIVRMTLGDYRRARRLSYQLEEAKQ